MSRDSVGSAGPKVLVSRAASVRKDRQNGGVHAAAVRFDLHVPASRSLKAKRAAIRPVVDRLRHRHRLSVAEVDHHDQWQRAAIAIAVVAGTDRQLRDLIEGARRFVDSRGDIELLSAETTYLDASDSFLDEPEPEATW